MRLAAAFDWNGVLSPANVRVDAWVTPPLYTGKPPIILSAANKEAACGRQRTAAGSGGQHADRALQRRHPRCGGGRRRDRSRARRAGAQGHQRAAFHHRRRRHRACPRALRPAAMEVRRDRRPRADHLAGEGSGASGPRLAADVLQDRGRLRRHRSAARNSSRAATRPRTAEGRRRQGRRPRPLFDPPQFPLVLPNARTRNGVGQTVKDLSEDPYAGADVTLTLTAKDEAGNEGKSEPFNMRLPERLFTKPLARALIEQRRILALDANQNSEVYAALDALMIAPELFTPEAGQYLGLYSVARQLEAARTDDALREVVASLWALAVTIEDGNITDVDKALRAAQDALKQALERGASDEEIKKLTENLRAALDNFLRQLAEQLRNNPQQLARPLDPNTKMLRQQDLNNMIERMERLSRSGDKDAARQSARAAAADAGKPADGAARPVRRRRHGAGAQRTRRHDPQAAAIARQDLQAGPGFAARPHARQAGRPEHGRPAAGPAGPARPAEEAAGGARQARHGTGPARRKGPAGRAGTAGPGRASKAAIRATARTASTRPIPRWAMPTAGSAKAMPTARSNSQGKALDALRKGAQKPCGSDAAGRRRRPATARATASAGSRAAATRPIRSAGPLHGREFGDDLTVKIPGEIDVQRVRRILEELRRRLADPARPQIELDYIERLLKDY